MAKLTTPALTAGARLRLFDAATERQRAKDTAAPWPRRGRGRGWTRRALYERGRAR